MRNILLIGGGQLGSRHLQALKKVEKEDFRIFVMDPSPNSLEVCSARFEEVSSEANHQLHLVSTLEEVTVSDLFLCVVATNSACRFEMTLKAAKMFKINSLLLEKILFNHKDQYLHFIEAIGDLRKSTWVNCCMRMQDLYKEMRGCLDASSNGPLLYDVSGSQFGLVTNAIHYVDHACYLIGNSEFEVDTSRLGSVIESKRKGFYEINGTLSILFSNGSVVNISCLEEGSLPVEIGIKNKTAKYIVRENEDLFWHSSEESKWRWSEDKLGLKFQSNLTNIVVENILDGEAPTLPSIEESCKVHLNLLPALGMYASRKVSGFSESKFLFT